MSSSKVMLKTSQLKQISLNSNVKKEIERSSLEYCWITLRDVAKIFCTHLCQTIKLVPPLNFHRQIIKKQQKLVVDLFVCPFLRNLVFAFL